MELEDVVARYSAALSALDRTITPAQVGANAKTGRPYLPGVRALSETKAVAMVDDWWASNYPQDFPDITTERLNISYPGLKRWQHRTGCDHVFTTFSRLKLPEWAIEWKRIQLVGDNGKKNDYGVGKTLSPYLKDRSLYHDVRRLRHYGLASRHAVVVYGFNYDDATLSRTALEHPGSTEVISNLRETCEGNGGHLLMDDLMDFAENIFRGKDLVIGPRVRAKFDGWRHPAGGQGVLFAWEVNRPEFNPNYDPRNPM